MRIADQFHGCAVTDVDAPELGLLEIAFDAECIEIDERQDASAGIDVTARQQVEVGDEAVDRRHDGGAFEVQLGDVERRIGVVDLGLRDIDGLLALLYLLHGDGDAGQILASRQIALGLIEGDLAACHLGLRLLQRILKAPLIPRS